ncbi:shikimate dehydrogenase [Metabacillus sp. GX 13764]|uniref:shikimate dehydrogenase n=1 Tax=Metabacillus kandeliae TaxID=2900151 RepID=UPI001E49CF84|nr:shikimate dehydrogenase [Metabacillus kandeliae]MCD7033022.1 shikimate dehydrogenase [Metabacillus kandeliae]
MTDLYGLIGFPVSHSMSPAIHNEALQDLQLDAHYHAFKVEEGQLEAAVNGLKAIGIKGFNVTVPYKEAIIPYLDEVEETASAIGAVNTVVHSEGRLIGYNTDGKGFYSSLKPLMTKKPEEAKMLIIGAGGAARAIYFSMATVGCLAIDICNRTPSKAEKLIEECPAKPISKALSLAQAEADLAGYDMIIQTTSIGMHPDTDSVPISLEKAGTDAIVCDIVYNPLKTAFLQQAEQKGCRTLNGAGMLAYQAALAFEYWTGIHPDAEKMKTTVIKKLGGSIC